MQAVINVRLENKTDIVTESIRKTLLSMADEKYRDFSSKLMPNVKKERVIGIRIPHLRKFSKELENYGEFLKDLPHKYFEEDNLHAFLIEREKDFEKCIKLLDEFLPYVNNWATCDSMKPKVLKKHPEKLLIHVKRWINSKDMYATRYAINLLMSFYLDENFDKKFLLAVASVKSEEYYINMMRAWYFATALAKQYDETLPYIENNILDVWTHNKTIQKSVESHRISEDKKEFLKRMRRK